VILGDPLARYFAIFMAVMQYIFVAYLVAIGFFGPLMLITFLGLFWFFPVMSVYLKPRPQYPENPNSLPKNYPKKIWPLYFVAFSFQHNRAFGGFFLLGLLLDTLALKFL